jgi:hypothetical protein
MAMQVHDQSRSDGFQAVGAQLLDSARNLLHEGNARKVSITRDGDVVAEFPLTFGVIGAVLAPAVAALGAITALATHCRIEVTPTDAE